jgi:putative oxidoreductase
MSDTQRLDLAALILRIGMGVLFVAHGLVLKVLTFTPAGTVHYFESIGYPGFVAWLVMAAEIGGGFALLLGLYSRWVALGLIPLLLGAMNQHLGNGWVFTSPNGGWEYPAFWTLTLVVQALLGDGRYSVVQRLKFALPGRRVLAESA